MAVKRRRGSRAEYALMSELRVGGGERTVEDSSTIMGWSLREQVVPHDSGGIWEHPGLGI